MGWSHVCLLVGRHFEDSFRTFVKLHSFLSFVDLALYTLINHYCFASTLHRYSGTFEHYFDFCRNLAVIQLDKLVCELSFSQRYQELMYLFLVLKREYNCLHHGCYCNMGLKTKPLDLRNVSSAVELRSTHNLF